MRSSRSLAVAATCLAAAPHASAYVYWTNFNGDTIGRAELDGSRVKQGFIRNAATPNGVTVDDTHVCWANFGIDAIGRANLDGSRAGQSLICPTRAAVARRRCRRCRAYLLERDERSAYRRREPGWLRPQLEFHQHFIVTASAPNGVTVNAAHVYWSNTASGAIGRASLNGQNIKQSFITGADGAAGVAVDRLSTPNTKITKAKVNQKRRTARFSFRAIGRAKGFACALTRYKRKARFAPCRSPETFRKLSRGGYRFSVRAKGVGGNDPTSAKKRFTIR